MMLLTSVCVPALTSRALAEAPPLSAIEWLSDSVAHPTPPGPVPAPADPRRPAAEPAAATRADREPVSVQPLGQVTPGGVGLVPAAVSGLPRALWGPASAAEVTGAIRGARVEMIPALQGLLLQVLLAETDPPDDAGAQGDVLLARLDKLLEIGALDQAAALIERAGPARSPEIFRRGFDVALLTGTDEAECRRLADTPSLSPTYPARIFCDARTGDWDGAALTLGTAQALEILDDAEADLLARFLDPVLFEGEPAPQTAAPMTPLNFRLLEAIGEAVPTGSLPRAFAVADLGGDSGWKAQIEAAERLVRAGALPAERLIALYSEARPAASGGIWRRAAAIQALDAELAKGTPGRARLATLTEEAWAAMAEADLEPALGDVHGARLGSLGLTGEAGSLAFRLALLSEAYEAAARSRQPANDSEAFLAALARGEPPASRGYDPTANAIADAFADTPDASLPAPARELLSAGRVGEAILMALDLVDAGAGGEVDRLAGGLAVLRALGLEGTARRAALAILILDRRG